MFVTVIYQNNVAKKEQICLDLQQVYDLECFYMNALKIKHHIPNSAN